MTYDILRTNGPTSMQNSYTSGKEVGVSSKKTKTDHKSSYEVQDATLSIIPEKVWVNIFSFLTMKEMPNLSLSCKLFNQIFKKEEIWKVWCKQHFSKDVSQNCLKEYQMEYNLRKVEYNLRNGKCSSYYISENFDGLDLFKKEESDEIPWMGINKSNVFLVIGDHNHPTWKKVISEDEQLFSGRDLLYSISLNPDKTQESSKTLQIAEENYIKVIYFSDDILIYFSQEREVEKCWLSVFNIEKNEVTTRIDLVEYDGDVMPRQWLFSHDGQFYFVINFEKHGKIFKFNENFKLIEEKKVPCCQDASMKDGHLFLLTNNDVVISNPFSKLAQAIDLSKVILSSSKLCDDKIVIQLDSKSDSSPYEFFIYDLLTRHKVKIQSEHFFTPIDELTI